MKHGNSAYRNYGCRCDECRTDHAIKSRQYREKNVEARRSYEVAYRETHPRDDRLDEFAKCLQCGASYRPWSTKTKFCSPSCSGSARVKSVSERKGRLLRYLPNHPLASAKGRVLAYRVVLYNQIGPGSHPCHWCGKMVTWVVRVGAGAGRDELAVDHLDGDKHNNDPMNLVPSCNECNVLRAYIAGWTARTGRPIADLT